jgi:hypothetical protein
MWATLRKRVLKVRLSQVIASSLCANRTQIGLIEDLFQIQNNAFHLASSGVYLTTPVFGVVALFCWIMPIATVYPPGALIVELHVLPINTTYNVSVFHANDYLYDTDPKALSLIHCSLGDFEMSSIQTLRGLSAENPEHDISFLMKGCRSIWWVQISFQGSRFQPFEFTMLTHIVVGGRPKSGLLGAYL